MKNKNQNDSGVKVTADQWGAMPWKNRSDAEVLALVMAQHGEIVTRERVRQARIEHGRPLAKASEWRERRSGESISRLERLQGWLAKAAPAGGVLAAKAAFGAETLQGLSAKLSVPEGWLSNFLESDESSGDRKSLIGTASAVVLTEVSADRKPHARAIPWDAVGADGWDRLSNGAVAALVRAALPEDRRAQWDVNGRALVASRRRNLFARGAISKGVSVVA